MFARAFLVIALSLLAAAPAAGAAPGWGPPFVLGPSANQLVRTGFAADGTAAFGWRAPDDTLKVRVKSPGAPLGPVETVTPPAETIGAGFAMAVAANGTVGFTWGTPTSAVRTRSRLPGGGYNDARTASSETAPAEQATGQDLAIAMRPNGDVVLAWHSFDHPVHRIRTRIRFAEGFFEGGPEDVSFPNAFDPAVATNARGEIAYVYRQDPKVATSLRLFGEVLGPPIEISPSGNDPKVAIDPAGNATYVWRATRVQTRRRTAAGVLEPITDVDTALSQNPEVTVADNGTARFAWSGQVKPSDELQAQTRTRTATGVFGPPEGMSIAGQPVIGAGLAGNGAGDAIVGWSPGTIGGVQARAILRGATLPIATIVGPSAGAPTTTGIDPKGNGAAAWNQNGVASAALFDATADPPKDTLAPRITSLRMLRKRFRLGTRKTAVTARRTKRGSAFRFRLSEQATVKITIQRPAKGRKVGKTCRRPTRQLKRRKPCTRFVRIGTLTRKNLKAGARSVAFSGRFGRKRLSAGPYRAVLVATDAVGNKSRSAKVAFRVVRR